MGTLSVRIVDDLTGQEMAARVYHTAVDGKPYTPPDSYERLATLSRHLFHTPGHYTTHVPVGPFTIEVAQRLRVRGRQDDGRREGRRTTSRSRSG